MTQNIALNTGDIAVEPFFDSTQEMLGASAPSFRIYIYSSTSLRLYAGSGNDQQCVAVNGRFRYRTSSVDAAHPGGSAGTHSVYVTAANNNFTGLAPTVDSTDYSFGLQIKTSGTPSGVDQYRKVGEVDWDGSQITAFRQQVGSRYDGDPGMFIAPLSTVTPLQVRAAASQSADLAKMTSSSGTTLFKVTSSGGAQFADAVTVTSLTASGTITADRLAGAGSVPTATVVPYAGTSAPSGWLLCDGSEVSRTTYSSLYSVLGTYYGSGDGSNTFNVPTADGCIINAS